MKNNIIIGLLAVIAGALIWIAVGRMGPDGATANASTTTEPAATQSVNSLSANIPAATPVVPPQPTPVADGPKTTMKFTKYEHDFGTVKQNTANTYVFKMDNTGTTDLLIYEAKASCGCTVPDYSKAPIPPGKTGEIKVTFNAPHPGLADKTVTVKANTEPGEVVLRIKANVEGAPGAEKQEAGANPMMIQTK